MDTNTLKRASKLISSMKFKKKIVSSNYLCSTGWKSLSEHSDKIYSLEQAAEIYFSCSNEETQNRRSGYGASSVEAAKEVLAKLEISAEVCYYANIGDSSHTEYYFERIA